MKQRYSATYGNLHIMACEKHIEQMKEELVNVKKVRGEGACFFCLREKS